MSEARKRWKFPIPYGLPRSAIDYRRNPETLSHEITSAAWGNVSDNFCW